MNSNTYDENFAEALDTVLGMRRMAENAWENEQQDAAHAVMNLNAEAYSRGYFDALLAFEAVQKGDPAYQPNPYINLKAK